MPQTIHRKCAACDDYAIISKNDMNNAVLYKTKYYHRDCFVALCKERMASKNKTVSSLWQSNLDNIEMFAEDAKKKSIYKFAKDDLNEHILKHYRVVEVPNRFWSMIDDLAANGQRNKKKCNPVDVALVSGCWIWGQKHLDAIARNNRKQGKGPKSDQERLNYDLAVVLGHIDDYKKYLAKIKAEEVEKALAQENKVKVDYSNIAQNSVAKTEGLDDISSLLDDMF